MATGTTPFLMRNGSKFRMLAFERAQQQSQAGEPGMGIFYFRAL
jgi:hypothetical protein